MNNLEVVNSFGEQKALSGASVQVAQSRAITEVQAAVILAKQFPRDQRQAMQRVLDTCARQGLAEKAIYTYPKGGQNVSGASIRLAEAIAQNWGNLDFGFKEIEQKDGESTVEAYAWDLETNTRQTKTFHVAHIRHTRQGSRKLEDPRDIYELVANQGARRLRSCILGIIPGDVVEAATVACEKTLADNSPVNEETVSKMIDAFSQFGVSKEQLEAFAGRSLITIEPAMKVRLQGIYNSLKDGMGTPAQWFPPEHSAKPLDQGGTSGIKQKLAATAPPSV